MGCDYRNLIIQFSQNIVLLKSILFLTLGIIFKSNNHIICRILYHSDIFYLFQFKKKVFTIRNMILKMVLLSLLWYVICGRVSEGEELPLQLFSFRYGYIIIMSNLAAKIRRCVVHFNRNRIKT